MRQFNIKWSKSGNIDIKHPQEPINLLYVDKLETLQQQYEKTNENNEIVNKEFHFDIGIFYCSITKYNFAVNKLLFVI